MSDQAEEQSVEDRMAAFLDAESPQEEETPVQDQEQVETTDSEEEQPEPRTFRIKHDEQELDVPENEVIELAQKGYDYTIKTQKLGEERRSLEDRAQAIQAQEQGIRQQFELQQALIDEQAKVRAYDNQIAEYAKVDWQALSNSDPVQAQTLYFQYQTLKDQREAVTRQLQTKATAFQQSQQERLQKMASEGMKQLVKDIPDWSQDKAKQVREAARQYGFNDSELDQIYDPRFVRIMHDAAQFRALKQSQSILQKKVADKPPVIKPGGKDVKVVANSEYRNGRAQLKKTGDQNLAAKLIERML